MKLLRRFWWWFWAGRNDMQHLRGMLEQHDELHAISQAAASRVTRVPLHW